MRARSLKILGKDDLGIGSKDGNTNLKEIKETHLAPFSEEPN
jgi:hypothetical protein